MKKMLLGLNALMFLLFIVPSQSVAGNSNGNGSPQQNQPESSGNVYQFQQSNLMNDSAAGPSLETPPGAGPFLNVTDTFTVTGEVVACVRGGGLTLEIDNQEVINIFGIGPTWFWEINGMDRPALGDWIVVRVVTVDYGDTTRNIATSITYQYDDDSEDIINLRDEEGYPLWRLGRTLQIGQPNQNTP